MNSEKLVEWIYDKGLPFCTKMTVRFAMVIRGRGFFIDWGGFPNVDQTHLSHEIEVSLKISETDLVV